jgi:hypothetical protein
MQTQPENQPARKTALSILINLIASILLQ